MANVNARIVIEVPGQSGEQQEQDKTRLSTLEEKVEELEQRQRATALVGIQTPKETDQILLDCIVNGSRVAVPLQHLAALLNSLIVDEMQKQEG